MNKKVAIILINYKEYAQKYLSDCLDSIRKQDYVGEKNLYLVDNSSSEESYEFLKKNAPEAIIIRNENNDGFAKGNNDAIKEAFKDKCEFIVLFNMDLIADEKALSEMIKVAEGDNSIAAVQSRLMLWPEKNLLNSLGNSSHFLGFGFCLNYREEYNNKLLKNEKIFYPSGAAVLFKSSVLKEVGLFDESYFMYNEDQDLAWRIWLAGYSCVLAPSSIAYHKYEFSRSVKKYYFMDRNRIITILKNYSCLSLILIFPAFIIMELGLLFFSIKNKSLKQKLKVYLYFLNIFNWRRILKDRKIVQRSRKIKDYHLFDLMSAKISYQEISSPALNLANYFFSFYFIILKFIIKKFKI